MSVVPPVFDPSLLDALRAVEDPELPVSVVDLGLIVALERRGTEVAVDITFTAMGCPAMDMVIDDVRACLLHQPNVEVVRVKVVWDPIWSPSRLTQDGKDALREFGISV